MIHSTCSITLTAERIQGMKRWILHPDNPNNSLLKFYIHSKYILQFISEPARNLNSYSAIYLFVDKFFQQIFRNHTNKKAKVIGEKAHRSLRVFRKPYRISSPLPRFRGLNFSNRLQSGTRSETVCFSSYFSFLIFRCA